jgi:type IV pilus assembly protein PilE
MRAMTGQRPAAMRNPQRGVTLIELMVVVVVVAILAAVAIPSYTNSVQKSRRADAKSALTSAAQAMERWFTERNTYAGALLGTGGIYSATSVNGFYALTFAAGGATNTNAGGYTLQAAPLGTQASDSCGTYALDQLNNMWANGVSPPPAGCW